MAATEFGNGIHKLRLAMLIYLVGSILGIIGAFVGLLPKLLSPTSASAALASGTVYLIVLILGLVLGLVALWFMRSGFKTARKTDPRFGIGVTGTTLEIIGIIFIGVASVLLIITIAGSVSGAAGLGGARAGLFVTLGLIFIGGILAVVGAILVLVGFFRIGSNTTTRSSRSARSSTFS